MNAQSALVQPSSRLILATRDRDWCSGLETALEREQVPLEVVRVEERAGMARQFGTAARLWLVDDAWSAPLLLRRRALPAEPCEFLVRFDDMASASVVTAIEAGARGCLSQDADVAETVRALRAVLDGELWLSRHVYARVLAHLLGRVGGPAESPGEQDVLTERQRQIVACVGRGLSNKQIARQLRISHTTVKTHMHNIFERVGVSGRTLLALRAADGDPYQG